MRRLKYVESDPATRDRVAAELRSQERRAEAVLLYEATPNDPSLRQEMSWAVRHGVSFLVFLLRRMGAPVGAEDLTACAASAEARGRWYDAYRCHQALGDEAGIARVAEHLPHYKPAIPHNKV
jgi:hypothetical protein